MQAAAQGDSDRASRLCTAFAAYCSNAMLIWVSDTPQVPYPSAAFHMPRNQLWYLQSSQSCKSL